MLLGNAYETQFKLTSSGALPFSKVQFVRMRVFEPPLILALYPHPIHLRMPFLNSGCCTHPRRRAVSATCAGVRASV